MKKILFLFVALSSIQFANAQVRKVKGNGRVMDRDRKVQPFTKVEVSGDFEVVFLNNAFDKKVTLSGDMNLQALIETRVENGVLKVRYRRTVEIVSQTQPLKVTIPSKTITEITNEGSGKVSNLGAVEVEKFTLNNLGSGSVSFKLKTDEATINLKGSGNINLSGTSNTLIVKSAGSGTINAKELSAFYTNVEMNGSGDVYSNTVNGIDGNINGSGNLYYRVTKTVNVTQNGSGKVIKE